MRAFLPRGRNYSSFYTTCHYYLFFSTQCISAFSFLPQVTDWLDHQRVAFECIESNDVFSVHNTYQNTNATKTHLLWIHAKKNQDDQSASSTTKRLLLHLIPSSTTLDSSVKYQMTNQASQQPSATSISLIHLHQDQWERQTSLVQARLWHAIVVAASNSQHCHERRIYARQCQVRRITTTQAQAFLQQHHMWSSVSARFSYGLFDHPSHQTLVSVATFSSRRHIQRGTRMHRSHELLRFCTQSNVTVLGGCSKLIKAFERDVLPDDIVTVLDRDWTSTRHDNWKGFQSVHTMRPLPLAVRDGQRYHLIGAQYNTRNSSSNKTTVQQREFVPWQVYQDLNECYDAESAQQCLQQYGYHILYDAGVERLLKIVVGDEATNATELYQSSIPHYAASYYSPNAGIAALLRQAEEACK